MSSSFKYVIGIDEVGRGPIAGPVAVGAVLIRLNKSCVLSEVPNAYLECLAKKLESPGQEIKDSKKLTLKKRYKVLEQMKVWQKNNVLDWQVSFVDSNIIDDIGIVPAIRKALNNCLEKLNVPTSEIEETLVLLDGSLKAPSNYKYQETIIRGDDTEKVISLASIVAKISRDEKMEEYALLYPEYRFENHKGYGTADHYKNLKKYGLCPLHRRSFLKGHLTKL